MPKDKVKVITGYVEVVLAEVNDCKLVKKPPAYLIRCGDGESQVNDKAVRAADPDFIRESVKVALLLLGKKGREFFMMTQTFANALVKEAEERKRKKGGKGGEWRKRELKGRQSS